MVLGSLHRKSITSLTIVSTVVERESVYKIFGVNTDLKWDDHLASISSKAGKRLWFMKQLRKAGVSQDDLLHYHQSVVRPVLEYAGPCWHFNLSKEQTKQLEDLQCRALPIIFGNMQYDKALRLSNILMISCVAEGQYELSRTFLQRIIRDKSTRLCSTRLYATIYALTNRYKNSLIVFALNHFQ